ncbi:Fc.00g070700.m01.CDS01 [Cosmosporella sp. VM-42]
MPGPSFTSSNSRIRGRAHPDLQFFLDWQRVPQKFWVFLPQLWRRSTTSHFDRWRLWIQISSVIIAPSMLFYQVCVIFLVNTSYNITGLMLSCMLVNFISVTIFYLSHPKKLRPNDRQIMPLVLLALGQGIILTGLLVFEIMIVCDPSVSFFHAFALLLLCPGFWASGHIITWYVRYWKYGERGDTFPSYPDVADNEDVLEVRDTAGALGMAYGDQLVRARESVLPLEPQQDASHATEVSSTRNDYLPYRDNPPEATGFAALNTYGQGSSVSTPASRPHPGPQTDAEPPFLRSLTLLANQTTPQFDELCSILATLSNGSEVLDAVISGTSETLENLLISFPSEVRTKIAPLLPEELHKLKEEWATVQSMLKQDSEPEIGWQVMKAMSIPATYHWQDELPTEVRSIFLVWSIVPIVVLPWAHGAYVFAKSCNGKLNIEQSDLLMFVASALSLMTLGSMIGPFAHNRDRLFIWSAKLLSICTIGFWAASFVFAIRDFIHEPVVSRPKPDIIEACSGELRDTMPECCKFDSGGPALFRIITLWVRALLLAPMLVWIPFSLVNAYFMTWSGTISL